MRVIDLTGQRFGRLVVLERAENLKGKAAWKCKCDCGKELIVSSNNLRRGNTASCGCYCKEQTSKSRKTHGLAQSRIYHTWNHVKDRCLNPSNNVFRHYGGRGITICEEWKNSFQAFYDHVSQLPHFGEKGYSIDRINNDGNYEPGNVRWATRSEQNKNRRKVKKNGT